MSQSTLSNLKPTQLNLILHTTVVGTFPLFDDWFDVVQLLLLFSHSLCLSEFLALLMVKQQSVQGSYVVVIPDISIASLFPFIPMCAGAFLPGVLLKYNISGKSNDTLFIIFNRLHSALNICIYYPFLVYFCIYLLAYYFYCCHFSLFKQRYSSVNICEYRIKPTFLPMLFDSYV